MSDLTKDFLFAVGIFTAFSIIACSCVPDESAATEVPVIKIEGLIVDDEAVPAPAPRDIDDVPVITIEED